MKKLFLKLIALISISICFSQAGYTHSFPSCASTASDPDNDRYGFENGISCVVDAFSAQAPEFTNLETGDPVSLIRAYWSETDFYKETVCSTFFFNGSAYERNPLSTYRLRHGVLSTTDPDVGEVEITYSRFVNGVSNNISYVIPWELENGIYGGENDLGRSPWLEPVTLNNGKAFVRIWMSEQIHVHCSAINDNDFFNPTGTPPETGNTFDGTCVDTGTLNDGWGWDGSSSCRIAPAGAIAEGECMDSDGDGWGWNGVSSCLVESTEVAQCIDTDGDGWGWNGSASCRI